MSWNAHLHIDYTSEADRTVARHLHSGPLRLLQSLYPEAGGVCHNVLVHPPGGLVGGDLLDMQVHVETGAHAVLTTPGATRFYRTNGALAVQRLSAHVASGAKLEWLPIEAIAYAGCRAENHMQFNLAQGAQLMAWDVTALGLPASGLGFFTHKNIADNARGYWTNGQFSPQNAGEAPVSTQNGSFLQHLELPGLWLERGRVRADDAALQLSPVGLAGNTCMGSFVLAAGSAMPKNDQNTALEAARTCIAASSLAKTAAATAPNPRMVVVRALGSQTEPMMALFKTIRAAWRGAMWAMPDTPPRIWAT